MKIGGCRAASERWRLVIALAGFFVFLVTVTSGLAQAVTDVVSGTGQPKNQVVATIQVGTGPSGVIVSPDSKTVYVANAGSNTVSVINATTNTVTATIPVGSYPGPMAITRDGAFVYVGNASDRQELTVSVIAAATNTVTTTIEAGLAPLGYFGIAVSPDGQTAYLPNGYPGTGVIVIDTATNEVSGTIKISDPRWIAPSPSAVAFSSSGSFAYVTSSANRSSGKSTLFVSKIDTTTKKQISASNLSSEPGSGSVSIYGHKLYVATYKDIVVFDTKSNTVVKRVPFANVLTADALAPGGTYLYVTYSNKVATIETATDQLIGSPIQVGQGEDASSLAVAPNGQYAYVTNGIDNTLSVIDISTQ